MTTEPHTTTVTPLITDHSPLETSNWQATLQHPHTQATHTFHFRLLDGGDIHQATDYLDRYLTQHSRLTNYPIIFQILNLQPIIKS